MVVMMTRLIVDVRDKLQSSPGIGVHQRDWRLPVRRPIQGRLASSRSAVDLLISGVTCSHRRRLRGARGDRTPNIFGHGAHAVDGPLPIIGPEICIILRK